MIKKERLELLRRRVQCNLHGLPVRFRCQYSGCTSHYLCEHADCLEQHFHEGGKMVVSRFDSQVWESKLQQVENVLNTESLREKQGLLTRFSQFLSNALHRVGQDFSRFDQVRQQIVNSKNTPIASYFENINGFLSLSSKIERRLDELRAKIAEDEPVPAQLNAQNLPPQAIDISDSRPLQRSLCSPGKEQINGEQEEQGQYFQNRPLTAFLKKYIEGFDWGKTEMIFSNQSQLTSCEKFHQRLRERKKLLFLFIGEQEIIGSFYLQPYPSTVEKHRQDKNSFIFVSEEKIEDKFALFRAEPQSENHMTVSQKLLICQGNTPNNGDGLRTFQRNFESLAYFLPSLSFRPTPPAENLTYNSVLRIREFYILQLITEN